MQAWLLKIHRWVALVFALPLLVVLATGLVLSFEPWVMMRAIQPSSVTPEKIESLLKQHDPSGQARGLVFRSYDRTLTIGAGRGGGTVVNLDTARPLAGPSATANILVTMRRLHETLLLDLGWLVIASTVALMVLALLGVLMGWPRISNTLSGWHKGMAWGMLPLIILSPLTALLMAGGITFAGPRPALAPAAQPQGQQLRLAEAVRVVGRSHDLSSMIWLRPQGGRLLVRLMEGGETRVHVVTRDGTQPTPRNWPRLLHEGNFAGGWSALMNIVTSLALLGLLGTGLTIWALRTIRRRARRAVRATAAAE